ncbi:MAG: hypothetical protein MZW92_34710 [Comamonadaceae bacterium]|nr:hypothetical protein [Comamonadaceae bacterium]
MLRTLTATFNFWLDEGLDGQPVRIVDMATIGAAVHATPSAYGFVNTTTPACDAAEDHRPSPGDTDHGRLVAVLQRDRRRAVPRPARRAPTRPPGSSPTASTRAPAATATTPSRSLRQLESFGWIAANDAP